jgi:hypothetical protein
MRDRISEIILTYDDTEALHLVHPDGYCEGCKDTPCIDNSNLRLTDAIIAALPEMIPNLVWVKRGKHIYSGDYTLFNFVRGLYVEYRDFALGADLSLVDAKAAANAHHRASIMAAFTGETT